MSLEGRPCVAFWFALCQRARPVLLGLLLAQAAWAQPAGSASAAGAAPTPASVSPLAALSLTDGERAWLAAHPVIRIGVDPAYAPYAFIDAQGRHAGASADVSAIVAERLGVRFELVPGLSWPQILEAARKRELDLVTTAAFRPERAEYLAFTKNYLMTPSVVMTRNETPRIRDLQELNGRRVALVKAYSSSRQFLDQRPGVKPVLVATPLEGLRAVATGNAEAYVGVLGISTYLAAVNGIANLKVNTGFDMGNGQAYGVRSDWAPLVPLLQKALDSIPEDQMQALLSRWIAVAVDSVGAPAVTLDSAARARLAALPVLRVGVLPSRAPFDFYGPDGEHTGLAADVLALVRERTGIRTRMVPFASAQAMREQFANGELDLLMAVNGRLSGVAAETLSEPYFSSALGVFARKGDVFLGDIGDLLDKRVAVSSKGLGDEILAQYPRIILQAHRTLVEAARSVLAGRADYMVAETTSALRAFEQAGLAELSYAGPLTSAAVTLHMAISPQLSSVRPSIDMALRTISSDEAMAIRRRWVGSPVDAGLPWRPVLQWAGATLLLVLSGFAAFYAWNRRLRREIALRVRGEANLVEANAQRQRFEQRYRDSIDVSPNLLLTVASDGRISQVSAALARLAGYEREALVGQPALELVAARDRDEFAAAFAAFFKSPEPLPSRADRPGILLCKDGRELPVEATVNPVTTSQGLFALITVVDISARIQAEERLRESEERLRDLFENASDLIQAVDPTGRFLYVNRSWCEALGYSADEARGLSLEDVIHPDSRDHCRALFEQVMLQKDVGRVEAAFVTRQGQRLELEGQISLRLRDGRPESTRAIFRDVTQRNRQLAALAQAKQRAEAADRTKSAFLATMSHELRTPLNSIIGFTGIVSQGLAGPLNAEQARQLGMVNASAQHLLALINDVLDLSKIEAGELRIDRQPFDLRASIEKVVAIVTPLVQKKGLALRCELPAAMKPMLGDARRVEQVLLNLLSNAIKFTPRGEVTLRAQARTESVLLQVQDSGIGIKPQDLARLFQPFQQIDAGLARNHEGTGLGLAISQKLAHLMGGDMRARSQWENGSTFSFEVPYQARESA